MPATRPKSRLWILTIPLFLASLLVAVTLAGAQTGREESIHLRLQAGSFDPLRELGVQTMLEQDTASSCVVIQFEGPVLPEWQAALAAEQITPLAYLPDYAYVVRLPPVGREAAWQLPGVRWVGYLPQRAKIAPELWESTGQVTVTVQFYAGTPIPDTAGIDVLDQASTAWGTTLRLQGDAAAIAAIAGETCVEWIEPYEPPRLLNDVAAQLTGASQVKATLGVTGAGQIVAVADTGLDVGASGAITDFGNIVDGQCLGRTSPCLWDDPDGHGTHVAGSAVGGGLLSGGQFQGIAPGAGLVVQSLYSPSLSGGLYLPADLNLLYEAAYTEGARVHNDSWGTSLNRYDIQAQQTDQFVWEHPEMVIVAAAGNGGIDRGGDGLIDPGSLYSPATAKNVIAVGASESLRTGLGYTGSYGDSPGGDNFPVNPVHDDLISDNSSGLAAFSSHGPAADGRIKPDLVAPGTNIVSARSHHASASYPFVYDEDYAIESGTSQATPLVSGAAALVRQYVQEQGGTEPSAALVKAILIHGATDLRPGQYGAALDGTLVLSDDVESGGIWTSTLGSWEITNTVGYHSPENAWLARGTDLGFQRLDAQVDLSGVVSPSLSFWNRRSLTGSAARLYVDGVKLLDLSANIGGQMGWAVDVVNLDAWAGDPDVLIRFEFQCQSNCNASSTAHWALDDITVSDGARGAEVGAAPDAGQGWGRLSLETALPSEGWRLNWQRDNRDLGTGDEIEYFIELSPTLTPLRATLVWNDYPASPAAAQALVNDLDLTLVDPNDVTHYANGLASADRTNNVEQIEWLPEVEGAYRLVVSGYNVSFGPQPYALVVTWAEAEQDFMLMVTWAEAEQVFLPLVTAGP